MIFLLLIAFATILAAEECVGCINLIGGGATAVTPMLKQWAFSYSLLQPSVDMEVHPVGGDIGLINLTTKCRKNYQYDVAVTDINYLYINRNNLRATYQDSANAQIFPYFAGAVVLTYNLPGVTQQIQFSRDVLLRIYGGNITWWDDPAITAINGNIMPHQRITLVVHNGNIGSTAILTQMLSNIDNTPKWHKTFNFSITLNWTLANTRPLDANYTSWQKNSFAVVSTVLTKEYTLGYAPLPYVDQAGLPYALLENKQGKYLSPNPPVLKAALDGATAGSIYFGNLTNQQVADAAGDGVYPLSAMYYVAFQTVVDTSCDERRELFKFFKWTLHDDAANAQILGSIGYGPFSAPIRNQLLEVMKKVKCQGQQLLRYDFPSSSTPLRQSIVSISWILIAITLIILGTLGWKRKSAITKAAGLAFASCFLIGCMINYISVLTWSFSPDTNQMCEARYILTSLGYTLILGAMFAKCWEIKKVFDQAKNGDFTSPLQEMPWWTFCRDFFAVVGVNILILMILGSIDPPKTMVHVVDELNLKAIRLCYVWDIKAWAGLETVYFGLLLGWGGYLAFKTRDIWEKYNYPNESRSILLSIYNLVFCLSILLPLSVYVSADVEVQFFLTSVAIIFPTSFALFSVYGPKIVSFLGSSFKRSKGSKGAASSRKQDGSATVKTIKEAAGDRKDHEEEKRKVKTPVMESGPGLILIEEDPHELSDREGDFHITATSPVSKQQSPSFTPAATEFHGKPIALSSPVSETAEQTPTSN